jgi:hypothetical protein
MREGRRNSGRSGGARGRKRPWMVTADTVDTATDTDNRGQRGYHDDRR